jgi:uncharacterized protein (DUF488 family)
MSLHSNNFIMANAFFTIGHSTRALPEFVRLLQAAGVRRILDVRSVPRSRTNPQYNADVLPGTLSGFGVGYEHLAALGGLRGRRQGVPPEINAFWQNQSFHNYADYALSESFRSGFDRLRELGHAEPCAVMCAEALWWRCHRRIIADYLIAAGERVVHIMAGERLEVARLNAAARPGVDGGLVYPAGQ